jgi:hypothetical protein
MKESNMTQATLLTATQAAAAAAAVKRAKPTSTVSKADLTPEMVSERLELRVEKFVFDYSAGDAAVVALVKDAEPIDVTLASGEVVNIGYDSESPEVMVYENFYWLVETPATPIGSFAGHRREADGYYSLTLLGTSYSGKQLAHFVKTGEWAKFTKTSDGTPKEKKAAGEKKVTAFVPLTPAAKAAAKAAAAAALAARKAKKAADAAVVPQAAADAAPEGTSDIPEAGNEPSPFDADSAVL